MEQQQRNLAFAIFIFMIVAIVASYFIFDFTGLFAWVFVPLVAPQFQNTANTIAGSGVAFAKTAILGVLVILLIIGCAVDIFVGVKDPKPVVGIVSIFMMFLTVAIWLVANKAILNTSLLSIFNATGSPLQVLFSSSWLITSICATMLISAGLHLGGKPHP